jgi:antitoxin component YwqK of YwqJK toxin-antitoxin module
VEVPFKFGKVEGIMKEFYEKGNIKSEIPFKNDEMEGLAKGYYESGRIKSESPYKNNKAVLEIQYKNNSAVSGVCIGTTGKRTPLTAYEISYWNNGEKITCE